MLSYSVHALIVFSRVVKCKSFSKAAEMLFMTQPGVSNHITQLESQTGWKLIKRERGAFELTREGKTVFRYAERIEEMAWKLEDRLRSARSAASPSLHIGTTVNYAKKVMPYILGNFQKREPDIRIKLDAGSSEDMEKSLVSRQNDVIIVANQHVSKNIESFPFVKEELVVVTSRDHPLAARRTASLSDVHSYPFIIREDGSATRALVLGAFCRKNIVPSVLIEANSTEFIKEWVAQGKGVSIVIRRLVEEDVALRTIPLTDPLSLEVSVLFLKSKKFDPAIRRFVAFVNEISTNLDPGTAASSARLVPPAPTS